MALLDFLKKKAPPAVPGPAVPAPGMPPPPPPPGPVAAPVDEVIKMQQQGFSNNQIMQALQRKGVDVAAINDAFAQAEARQGPQPMAPPPPGPAFGPPAPKGIGRVQVEEIAESIVEEKWKEFSEAHTKLNEWREHADSRLDKFEQSLADVKADLENLHKAIVAKIGEYDKNLLAVGTEIKAMEKVFQKVLPTLTENVSELSRITSRVRKPVKK